MQCCLQYTWQASIAVPVLPKKQSKTKLCKSTQMCNLGYLPLNPAHLSLALSHEFFSHRAWDDQRLTGWRVVRISVQVLRQCAKVKAHAASVPQHDLFLSHAVKQLRGDQRGTHRSCSHGHTHIIFYINRLDLFSVLRLEPRPASHDYYTSPHNNTSV